MSEKNSSARIIVRDFSCIKFAEFEPKELNIIIGEQGSGKSVLSKIIFFLNDLLYTELFNTRQNSDTLENIERIKRNFKLWFPQSAWGKKKFEIQYLSGDIEISIKRKGLGKVSSQELSIVFSEKIKELIDIFHKKRNDIELQNIQETPEEPIFFKFMSLNFELNRYIDDQLEKLSNFKSFKSQLFIPAGRSFFTSLGKAISAFERSGMIDPITMRFGELYLSARQRISGQKIYYHDTDAPSGISDAMKVFFEGELIFKEEEEYIQTADGRNIPLPFLSSGQQELLPLWLSIEEAYFRYREFSIFIEEPEAHIFPETQSLLVEKLISVLKKNRFHSSIVITTHSPYVLAKVNNLLKAQIVGKKKGKSKRVSNIVPKESWISPDAISANTIKNGELVSIIDEEGLIDSDYLDEISSHISEEYMNLVEIELSK